MIPLNKQLQINYNLEERKVGKYLDGKDLYCKTILAQAPKVETDGTYSGNAEISIANLNPDKCFILEAYAITDSNSNIYPIPYINNSGRIIKCFYNTGLKSVSITTNGTAYSLCSCIIKLLYTKKDS